MLIIRHVSQNQDMSLKLGRTISPDILVDPGDTETFREKCLQYDVIFCNYSSYLTDKMFLSLKENL